MTATQKFSDFARRHEYGIILTSWAAALTGSFTYIMRDPYVRASWEGICTLLTLCILAAISPFLRRFAA